MKVYRLMCDEVNTPEECAKNWCVGVSQSEDLAIKFKLFYELFDQVDKRMTMNYSSGEKTYSIHEDDIETLDGERLLDEKYLEKCMEEFQPAIVLCFNYEDSFNDSGLCEFIPTGYFEPELIPFEQPFISRTLMKSAVAGFLTRVKVVKIVVKSQPTDNMHSNIPKEEFISIVKNARQIIQEQWENIKDDEPNDSMVARLCNK